MIANRSPEPCIIDNAAGYQGRVVIVNAGHTDNLGDQAIAFSLKRLFAEYGYVAELANRSNPTLSSVRKTSGHRLLRYVPKAIRAMVNQVRLIRQQFSQRIDLVTIGGGQLL